MSRIRIVLALLAVPLVGVSDCTGSTCDPSDGEAVFDVSPTDLKDYGVKDPTAIDADTCEILCEEMAGMIEVTLCESEDAGDGYATLYCEGLYDC